MSTYEIMLSVHGSEENARLAQLHSEGITGLSKIELGILAQEFQDYLRDHKDNRYLDVTELYITPEQVEWLIHKFIERKV